MLPARCAFIICLLLFNCYSGQASADNDSTISPAIRINFFVIAPPKKHKLDLGARYNILRGKIRGITRKKHFISIVADDAGEMSRKVKSKLIKENAAIGTLWFDSHGLYKKGYSLFFIGHDEFNFHTTRDSAFVAPLRQLNAYSDENSKIVIGSCYGGATYYRKSFFSEDSSRMNGDSLMYNLGSIFNKSIILGSESWVMTKPGLFTKKFAVAGYPSRRLFRDLTYQPAWERIGQWNIYYPEVRKLLQGNAITMDKYGNLYCFENSFTSVDGVQKRIDKKIKRLKPGLVDLKKI